MDISPVLLSDSLPGFCDHNLFNQFLVRARFHSNGKMWAKLGLEMSVSPAVCQSWDLVQQQKTKSSSSLTSLTPIRRSQVASLKGHKGLLLGFWKTEISKYQK